jgi:hypothetical protein
MSGLEFTPLFWAIPVAMTAFSSYDHRHPFAGQTFKIETAAPNSDEDDDGGLLQVLRRGCKSFDDVSEGRRRTLTKDIVQHGRSHFM